MIKYPHFALQNLYLENGYSRQSFEYGEVTTYSDEDGLEECIRRILVRTPVRFNGRQLRFLRRGLSLSQESLGELIDRDAQTVARMEKSTQQVPRYVDLVVRARYFAKFDPSKSIGEILSLHDLQTKIPQEKIVLFQSRGRWQFRYDIPHVAFEIIQSELTSANLPRVEINEGRYVMRSRRSSSTELRDAKHHNAPSLLNVPTATFPHTVEKHSYVSSN